MKHNNVVLNFFSLNKKRMLFIAGIFLSIYYCWQLVFAWGIRQALLPEVVARKLNRGMTYDQMLHMLGENSVSIPLKMNTDGSHYCILSDSGWGSFLSPQYQTVVIFDRQSRLVSGFAKIHYRMDEESVDLHLQ